VAPKGIACIKGASLNTYITFLIITQNTLHNTIRTEIFNYNKWHGEKNNSKHTVSNDIVVSHKNEVFTKKNNSDC